MARLGKTVYLAIHGHFYQPPRENPWTERIELQPSAAPFHDWNDRILIQCYQPNAMARVVDAEGKVLEIVNNFRLLNFNIGPTLFAWLEKHAPVVYHRILEGDRLSQREHSGRGNAIAQVYNHMILPLAREEEGRTQIRWGIFEFKKRFGRDPEGIWLPETAANERTLEILIEEGIRFTILAPEQAARIRPLQIHLEKGESRPDPHGQWQEVSPGTIDPTRPYRFFHSKDAGRWLDLFFFDGPLSRDVSFSDVLFDAKKLIPRLTGAHNPNRHHPELIHLAVDGETFGHHKAYGERVISFVLHREGEAYGLKRTNYSEYLEKFPPQFEVKIKAGEGTSWSCVHGVGRWKEDCGCHTGAEAGWNQKWRRPLREAVQYLESELARLYEKEGGRFFKDPWAARDSYIELILDRSEGTRRQFFEKHTGRTLSPEEEIRCLKLLEMERYAMLSETSCGWFFNDLAGIETVQILRYALRAFELAEEFGGSDIEKVFVDKLAGARSNRSEIGDGRAIWENFVKTGRVTLEKLAAHYAFRKLFQMEIKTKDFFNQEVEEWDWEHETEGALSLQMGRLRFLGKTIPESHEFIAAIFQEGTSRIQCFVKKAEGPEEIHKLDLAPLTFLRKGNVPELLSNLRRAFKSEPFFLRDLFPEEREEILWILSRKLREDLFEMASRFYGDNRPDIAVFREAGKPLPVEFRELMEWMMGERLLDWVKKLEGRISFEEIAKKGRAIIEEAQASGFSVRSQPTVDFLSRRLNGWIEKLFQDPHPELIFKIEKVLQLAAGFEIKLHDRIAQDLFFAFVQKTLHEWIEAYHRGPEDPAKLEMIHALIRVGGELGFNMHQYEVHLKQKAGVG